MLEQLRKDRERQTEGVFWWGGFFSSVVFRGMWPFCFNVHSFLQFSVSVVFIMLFVGSFIIFLCFKWHVFSFILFSVFMNIEFICLLFFQKGRMLFCWTCLFNFRFLSGPLLNQINQPCKYHYVFIFFVLVVS